MKDEPLAGRCAVGEQAAAASFRRGFESFVRREAHVNRMASKGAPAVRPTQERKEALSEFAWIWSLRSSTLLHLLPHASENRSDRAFQEATVKHLLGLCGNAAICSLSDPLGLGVKLRPTWWRLDALFPRVLQES